MDDLLESALAHNGNILSTRQVPSPLINTPGQIMWASDQRAWLDTIDHAYCKRNVSPPLSHLRWAVASTRDLLSEWRVGSEGSFTYVDVMVGSLWVVVAEPKHGDKDGFASTRIYGQGSSMAANTDIWDMQGVVMSAGTRL